MTLSVGSLLASVADQSAQMRVGPLRVINVNSGKWTPILTGDPQRIAYILGVSGTTGIYFTTDMSIAVAMGWFLNSANGPIVYKFADLGPWVQLPLWADGGDATDSVTVQEIFATEGG